MAGGKYRTIIFVLHQMNCTSLKFLAMLVSWTKQKRNKNDLDLIWCDTCHTKTLTSPSLLVKF